MARLLIYHHDDLDGQCSAAVMLRWWRGTPGVGSIEFREVGYKDVIDITEIQPDDVVAIVDFSFKPDLMAQVRERSARVIWCDHHITAKDYGYDDLDGFRDFSNKGLSGCECTWKFCFPDQPFPRALVLLGDYDAWRMNEKPECLEFYEGLKLKPRHPEARLWKVLLANDDPTTGQCVVDLIAFGQTAIRYRDTYCSGMLDTFGYTATLDGHYALVMNIQRFGSQAFGEEFQKYPMCIAYVHDGEQFTVSLYSETVDVGQVAKKFGGGGHKGAAGFICEVLPWITT